MRNTFFIFSALILIIMLNGCSTPQPPKNIHNICKILIKNKNWHKDANDSYKKWGIPVPVLFAIISQESKFKADTRPPRGRCLWFFPLPRSSSAFGYAQAKNETWEEYRVSTGNSGADRDDFKDCVDFVGWYCNQSHVRCGIARNDAYNLYLAYHEGHGGFNRGTFKKKSWLLRTARKVNGVADTYASQMRLCEDKLKRKGSCFLWPF